MSCASPGPSVPPMYAVLLCGTNAGDVEVLAHVPGLDASDAAARAVAMCVSADFQQTARIARAWYSPDVAWVGFADAPTTLLVVPVEEVVRFRQVSVRTATPC